MGNCQTVDAAALVIQHPDGKLDRMYCPLPAGDVMKANPGHYVSLIIPLPISGSAQNNSAAGGDHSPDRTVRFTRVKLLRPSDTLVLGRAYRLVTTQEVMKVVRAKKHGRMRENSAMDLGENSQRGCEAGHCSFENSKQTIRMDKDGERLRSRSRSTSLTARRSNLWRPSLQSISESSQNSLNGGPSQTI